MWSSSAASAYHPQSQDVSAFRRSSIQCQILDGFPHDEIDDYDTQKRRQYASLSNSWDNLKELRVSCTHIDTAARVIVYCFEDTNVPLRDAIIFQYLSQGWFVDAVECLSEVDEVYDEMTCLPCFNSSIEISSVPGALVRLLIARVISA